MLAAKRPKTALKKQPRSIIGKPRASASRSRLAPAATQYRAQLSLATISGLGNETAWKLAAVSPKRWPTGTVHTASWEPAVAPKDGVDLWTLDANAMTANGRLWATIDGPGGVELASIPLPWPVDSGEASVNVLVDTRIGGAAMTSVALTDAMYGGLLSYVAAGRISTVIPMIRHLEDTGGVEKALYGDDPNPLAVCIVAIARMATDPQDRSDKWDVWLRDLMERNPHIPDCAIVYARSVVIRPGELDESGNASRALRKAFDAGIPYYSTTLRLMRDMLFAGARRDEGLGAILEQVRPIVARCDPRGLTTVLRYPAGTE